MANFIVWALIALSLLQAAAFWLILALGRMFLRDLHKLDHNRRVVSYRHDNLADDVSVHESRLCELEAILKPATSADDAHVRVNGSVPFPSPPSKT